MIRRATSWTVRNRLIYLGVFICTFWSVALPQGLETNVGTGTFLPVTASLQHAAETLEVSDNAYYTKTAVDFVSSAPLTPQSLWAIRQWPPGFASLLAAPAIVLGTGYPVGLWVLLLNSIAWASLFFGLVRSAQRLRGRIIVCCVYALLLISPPFHDWIFAAGFLYTEGLATALVCIALFAGMRLSTNSRDSPMLFWKRRSIGSSFFLTIAAGSALAGAAYLRATYEFVCLCLLVLALLSILPWGLGAARASIRKTSRAGLDATPLGTFQRSVISLLMIALVAQALMLPWRVYVFESFGGSKSWTIQTDVYWGLRWAPTAYLESTGNGWFSEWGGNSACRIDSRTCDEIAVTELPSSGPYSGSGAHDQARFKQLALNAYLTHVPAWLTDRFNITVTQWTNNSLPSYARKLYGLAFLLALAAGALMSLSLVRRRRLVAPAIYFSIVAGTLGPLLLQLVEVRYLIPAQLCSVVFVLYMLIRRSPRQR